MCTLSSSVSTLSLNLISSISFPSHSTELDETFKPFADLELPAPPCPRPADAMSKADTYQYTIILYSSPGCEIPSP